MAAASLCDAMLLDFSERATAPADSIANALAEVTWLEHPAAKLLGLQAEQIQQIFELVPDCQLHAMQMAAG